MKKHWVEFPKIDLQQLFSGYHGQFVKNWHLKVRKTCLWALPFCVRHSVPLTSWTGSVHVADVYVLFHHQPTFVVFALDLVRSEPTWLRSAEPSFQSTEVFLLHKYWHAKSANRNICCTISTFSGQFVSSLGFRFDQKLWRRLMCVMSYESHFYLWFGEVCLAQMWS